MDRGMAFIYLKEMCTISFDVCKSFFLLSFYFHLSEYSYKTVHCVIPVISSFIVTCDLYDVLNKEYSTRIYLSCIRKEMIFENY